ncbi:MAG: PspA/IM30 family protein [Firmicutes bacterium]|nr:PspA/IM30 family protein [Bacillota bacterium]
MGIISRFRDIMAANVNSFLEKCEDPAKMVDQYMIDLTESLAEVKKETAAVMSEEKQAKRDLDENLSEVEKYADFAKKAIQAGNDEDAKVFISKKQALEKNGDVLKAIYKTAFENAQKMRDMHDKLTNDIQELQIRRQNIKSKMAVAKTQEKMNKISGSMEAASSSMNAFDRMEEKADRMLDMANSMCELNTMPTDKAGELEEKYSGAGLRAVDDELAKMKAELGM